MSNRPRKKKSLVIGYIIFFFTLAVPIMVALVIYVAVNRASDGDVAATTATMIIVIVALSVIYTVADIIRRRIMIDRPTGKILSATERIASGDFSVRLDIAHSYEKYDDYDLIMENLNVMAEELSKSEILKSDFISNVSHELKTPLAVIQSYASMLNSDNITEENRKKYARTVYDATKRLSDLISNILKLNKLENSQLFVETESIRLDEMLADTVIYYEDIIEKKGIEIECNFDEITVVSSKSYLEIVWNNLLSNAVKFTDSGGKITLRLFRSGESAVVEVADTGCGISPEVGARIFDKFYQADTSHSQEGNGLGLALVKKVIDILGGEISVKSEPNKGSTFTIALKQ